MTSPGNGVRYSYIKADRVSVDITHPTLTSQPGLAGQEATYNYNLTNAPDLSGHFNCPHIKGVKMDTELDQQVEKVLPQLDRVLTEALPEKMQKLFGYYTFLTLFHACTPHTPTGIIAAKDCLRKLHKQLELH